MSSFLATDAPPLYVQVAVSLPLYQTFTYRVPERLREKGRGVRGDRVLVSFGGRRLTGYVVGPAPATPGEGVPEVKDLLEVLDETPVVTEEIFKLTRWLADYYCAGWGEVLRTALPALGRGRRAPLWKLSEAGEEALATGAVRKGLRRGILEILSEHREGLTAGQTARQLDGHPESSIRPALRHLARQGWVETKNLPARRRTRPTLLAELVHSPEKPEEEKLKRRAPRQWELLRLLLKTPSLRLDALPAGLRGGPLRALSAKGWVRVQEATGAGDEPKDRPKSSPLRPTPHQTQAFGPIAESLRQGGFQAFLLHGVTASGKTELYLRAIEQVLADGKGAIVLVPEIALTPQLLGRFRERFGEQIVELHSDLSDPERYRGWRRAASGEVPIVVGARSAIFAPMPRLGLVVVDEEHEPSYKQEESPRYHARDVALVRGRFAGATVILGSATPSLESYWNGRKGKYHYLSMPKRVEERPLPSVSIVDMRKEASSEGILSKPLKEALEERLKRKEQSLLFLNRRGFASALLCRDCGHVAQCPHCAVSLTFHLQAACLRCHYCGHRAPGPKTCPGCEGVRLDRRGLGTQRVEETVQRLFPEAAVERMDRDTTRARGAHRRILDRLSRGEVDILIGTQMIAKGHDYPGITLVGVISADLSLNMPDFRAAERTFQLLTQVAGRAGRGPAPGEVFFQTYRPDHYCIRFARTQDYDGFCRQELEFRRELRYPPFGRLARLRVESGDAEMAKEFVGRLADAMIKILPAGVAEVMGPSPGVFPKLQNRYRWQVLLKASTPKLLLQALRMGSELTEGRLRPPSKVRFGVDVDPVELF